MGLGLSRGEELRHLDHMVTQEEWRELTGSDGEFHFLEHNISQIASNMLRLGACYRKFAIIVLGTNQWLRGMA